MPRDTVSHNCAPRSDDDCFADKVCSQTAPHAAAAAAPGGARADPTRDYPCVSRDSGSVPPFPSTCGSPEKSAALSLPMK